MSGRTRLALPLRQVLRLQCLPRPATRCLHRLPERPPTHHAARNLHPSPQTHRTYRKGSTGSFTGNAKILFRQYPFSMTFAVLCILTSSASIVWVNYYYRTYIIGAFHNYPEEVAKKLRRAIYFTSTDLNPQEAVKYYRQALKVAEEVGMDPMSDEVMGIKIQVAGLMERIEHLGKAIEVLERVREDNLKWLGVYDASPASGRTQELRAKRTHILAKTVAISVKLGDHYASPAIWERDRALERLSWAVETVEREKQRRQANSVTDEDEGRWMTDEEEGAALESLAQTYESRDLHYLATPLFLQALRLKEETDCHSVTLMSNLASCLAQQSPRAAREVSAYAQSANIDNKTSNSSDRPSGPVATKENMIQNAQLWAQKALDVAQKVTPPERTEECDVGCAVATHNLGEFAEMLKDTETARRRYKEAIGLARVVGFQEGVENSSERLRRLDRMK